MPDRKFEVNESVFEKAMGALISAPMSTKEGIKPTKVRKKIAARSKAPRRPSAPRHS